MERCIVISVIVLCAAAIWITSELTKPDLTDPIAQRIWAATHGTVSLSSEGSSYLIREATYADSVAKVTK